MFVSVNAAAFVPLSETNGEGMDAFPAFVNEILDAIGSPPTPATPRFSVGAKLVAFNVVPSEK